jgi:hypothetical protein
VDRRKAERARRIEGDARTQDFVNLFQRYGEMIVSHISTGIGQPIDPKFLNKVNDTVKPLLRQQVEELVKDYQRATYEALTGDTIERDEISYRTQFPRRRRHHLRFLTLAFADLVHLDEDSSEKAMFPKIILEGIDLWVRQSFNPDEIDEIGMRAFRALDHLDIISGVSKMDSDREMWRQLHEQDNAMALICPVLVPFLQKFNTDFEEARTHMQRAISQGTKGQVLLNAKSWDLLFARIFGRLLKLVGANENPEMAAKVGEVDRAIISVAMDKYRTWRAANQLR